MTAKKQFRLEHFKDSVLVIGSGAAGLSCALALMEQGVQNVRLITEDMNAGTSRNAGSDKQTYYKLSLAGSAPDSIDAMAEDLFQGGCVDGEHALMEASMSVPAFLRLVRLGVPFPSNEFGEYPGYITDHDTKGRATSCGPYTSKCMVEVLERELKKNKVRITDHTQVIKILRDKNHVRGVLTLQLAQKGSLPVYRIYYADTVIFATGGPAGIFKDSVYPVSQAGATGLCVEAGCSVSNITEWQFGIASKNPRWNVSGSYMQAIPRFISTKMDGTDPKEFLTPFFKSKEELLSCIFMKGAEWPFDVTKIRNGSSRIDLLVYRESVMLGRRVYLDFTTNPEEEPLDIEGLFEKPKSYLQAHDVKGTTPYERLRELNEPAVKFYLDHGVDLRKEPLEIAVCAQHSNGGLSVDTHMETTLKGLFACGEVACTHGVKRPGGSALNAGQVGALLIAKYLSSKEYGDRKRGERIHTPIDYTQEVEAFLNRFYLTSGKEPLARFQYRMTSELSSCGGMIRNSLQLARHEKSTWDLLTRFESTVEPIQRGLEGEYFHTRSFLYTQCIFAYACRIFKEELQGGSRGSALYTDKNGILPGAGYPQIFQYVEDPKEHLKEILTVTLKEEGLSYEVRKVHPIPKRDLVFEHVWETYRKEQ